MNIGPKAYSVIYLICVVTLIESVMTAPAYKKCIRLGDVPTTMNTNVLTSFGNTPNHPAGGSDTTNSPSPDGTGNHTSSSDTARALTHQDASHQVSQEAVVPEQGVPEQYQAQFEPQIEEQSPYLTQNYTEQNESANSTATSYSDTQPSVQPDDPSAGTNSSSINQQPDAPVEEAPADPAKQKCTIERGADLPISTNGKQDHTLPIPKNGRILNAGELDSVQRALNFPDYQYFLGKLKGYPHALWDWAVEEDNKLAAYHAMVTAMKLWMLPTWSFECSETVDSKDPSHCYNVAGEVYGALKIAGRDGNGAQIRSILEPFVQSGKATTGNLCDEMLVIVWGGNEHQKLHSVIRHEDTEQAHQTYMNFDWTKPLSQARIIFHGTHMTSLSDGVDPYWQSQGMKTTYGGYNNHGDWPEQSWFKAASQFLSLFPDLPAWP